MKQVIRIGEEPKEVMVLRPIEFTHYQESNSGWLKSCVVASDYEKIVYIGKDSIDGDLFSAYAGDRITIYKGHLNDGVY